MTTPIAAGQLDRRVRGDVTDPVCGNCGNPLTQHYVESHPIEGQRIYCNTFTNGDLFTSEPQESMIMDMLIDQYPDIYDGLINKWKIENGHAHNVEGEGAEPLYGAASLSTDGFGGADNGERK